MKYRSVCLLPTIYILLIILEGISFAQDTARPIMHPFWVGIDGGYGIASHGVSGLSCENGCPDYTGGIGGGPFFGALFDWVPAAHWGVSVHANYFFSALNMQAATSDVNVLNQNGSVVPLVRNYTITVDVPELMIGLYGSHSIGKLKLYAGPAAGFITSPTWSSSAHIVSPGNITYGNESKDTTFFPQQSLTSAQRNQLYISGGGSYDIPLAKNIVAAPEVHAFFPMTSLQTTNTWKETIVELGASVKFGFGEEEKIIIAEPPIPAPPASPLPSPTPLPPPPQLVAKISTNALYPDGTRQKLTNIRVSVQFVSEAFPILPFVFFDKNSSSIRERYNELAQPSGFSTQSLSPDPISIHRNILNITGERMRIHPDATITLRGYADPTTEKGDCILAESRAKEVRSYLTTVWGVAPGRILIQVGSKNCFPDFLTLTKSEDGYAENRRVEIQSNDPTILESIARIHFIEPVAITPPVIEYDPSGSSMNGIQNWHIESKQNDRLVFADSGAGNANLFSQPIGDSSAKILQGGVPIISSFTITDSSGHTASTNNAIPVVKDTLNTEVERLYLTLFGTSSDKISHKDSAAIHQFMDGFDPADSITILGYTDKLGDSLSNLDLSKRRAENVKSLVLSIAPSANRIYSEGIAFARYPPEIPSFNTPEERFLSRTVQIEVRKKRTQ